MAKKPIKLNDVVISMPLAYQLKDSLALLSHYFDGWKRGWEQEPDTREGKAEKIKSLQEGIDSCFKASSELAAAIQQSQ